MIFFKGLLDICDYPIVNTYLLPFTVSESPDMNRKI